MEGRRDPRPFIFFILLLWLLNSPDPQPQQPFNSQSRYKDVLKKERDELGVLNRTRFGDFDPQHNRWLNISGLRQDDGLAWDLLGPVQQRAREHVQHALGTAAEELLDGTGEHLGVPVYRNISGYVEGEWTRLSMSKIRYPSDLNISHDEAHVFTSEFDRNLTGSSGPVRIHFEEVDGKAHARTKNESASKIRARVIVGDSDSPGSNWWEFALHGVHYPHLGGAVLITTSERFAGVFALPHLQISNHLHSASRDLLIPTLNETIKDQEDRLYPLWNPWNSVVDGVEDPSLGSRHCEVVLYLQQQPIQFYNGDRTSQEGFDIGWLEDELRFPTGAPLPSRSPLTMSLVGFSPDCGFVIESKGPPVFSPAEHAHLVGLKDEEFNGRARQGILAFSVTLLVQIFLLVHQMKDTATPSTRNRVGFYTIAMLSVGDGFNFLALVFLHLFIQTSQLALFTAAFLSLLSVVFEMRFLMDIWSVQVTEQMRQQREQASTSVRSASQPSTTPSPPAGEARLPPPATATRPGTRAAIIRAEQNGTTDNVATPTTDNTDRPTPGRAELGALYGRYILLLFALFFLTLYFTGVRGSVRAFYFNTLCFLYLSFWCPQIYRNAMRNCRKALRWEFVLGQSVVRMLPIAYFYAVPNNILFSKNDVRTLVVLAGWVWLQILALLSQDLLGPRFFVREKWVPPAYDYHPVLREDEEGASMPIGSSQTSEDVEEGSSRAQGGESKGKGKKVFDCSICATDIEVPVVPSGAASENAPGLSSMILQRRAYMVTPCRHIFHTPCLEGWMRYRLQCPNCREVLPPL